MDDLDKRLKQTLSESRPMPASLHRATLARLRKTRPASRAIKPIVLLTVLSAAAGLLEMLVMALLLPHSPLALAVVLYGAVTLSASLGAIAYWSIPGLRDKPVSWKE